MLPQWRAQMEHELPAVLAELEAWGGLRINLISALPHERTGGWREGDEDFETVTGRRPVVEAAMTTVVDRTAGVDVRRGLAVTGLVAEGDGPAAVPRLRGVFTSGGESFRADLVVDASGRRSALPARMALEVDAAHVVGLGERSAVRLARARTTGVGFALG